MARTPVPPITRVYVLTDDQQVLVVTVAGRDGRPDEFEQLPLLRQFLHGCEAAGWSSMCVSASETPGEPGALDGTSLRAWPASWGRRVLH